MIRRLAATAAALGWAAVSVLATEPSCPRLEGHWGWGGSYAVGTGGGFGMFASGATLVLVEWPGGSELRELGRGRVDGWPTDFVISGMTAYVSVQSYGLQIFELGRSGGPSLVGTWRSTESPRALAVGSEHAFVADVVGLRVLDVSEPRRPIEVAALDLGSEGGGYDVELNGHYAFVTTGYELAVVDVQRPDDPVVISRLALEGYFPLLALDDATVWLAGGEPDLVAVDISDPQQPERIDGMNLPGIEWDLDVADGLVYVAAGTAGLQVIDGSDPGRASLVGTLDVEGVANGVSATANGALVAGGHGGVAAVDTTVPTHPTLVASWAPPMPEVEASDVAISGGHLVVADHSYEAGRLRVLDISDPRRPVELGFASLPSDAVAVAVDPGLAMVGHVNLYVDIFVDGGLTTVDLTDPSDPTVLGTLFVYGFVSDVAAEGRMAYLVSNGDLAVVDCSVPAAPIEIGRYQPGGAYFRAVDVDDGLAFSAGNYGKLCVADVADPSNPVDLGCTVVTLETSRLTAVDVRGALAAVIAEHPGAGPDTLVLIDVSDPDSPMVVSEVPTSGRSGVFSVASVVLTGDLAVVSLGLDNGILVFDIRDPGNPRFLGERTSKFLGSHGMAVAGEHLFLAGGNAGVDGYRLGSCRAPRRPDRLRSP